MELRFLCYFLTIFVMHLVLCDAQTIGEPGVCMQPVNVPKTRFITGWCKKGNTKYACRKTQKQFVLEDQPACCVGWVYHSASKKCIPNCQRGCRGGDCVAPETCQCTPPLVLKNNNSCEEPICNSPCVNANCVNDDVCLCNVGFQKHNITHCAPICLEGFDNDPLTLECKPKCDKCVNGNCTAPNICTCDEGYELKDSTCVPVCNQSCENGKCVAPDTCECNAGYTIELSNKSICIPKCDKCDHGDCVAPNVCHCYEGYFKSDGITCTPACSETCLTGYCSAPNTCSCNEGYELDSKDKFKCQPICNDGCINGICSSPDTCSCLAGFEKINSSTCRPLCKSCEHGVCVSPENCQCKDGFTKANGVCKPVCSSPCINGFCELPEKCACHDGFTQNLTGSNCYKLCTGACENGICTVNGTCQCDFGFEFFNNTCIKPDACDKCDTKCDDGICHCEDGRPCQETVELPEEAAQSTSLAGLQMTWMLAGCFGILIVTVVIITIGYMWRKRKEYGNKPTDTGNVYPNEMYTIPNTLIRSKYNDNRDSVNDNEEFDEDTTNHVSIQLLEGEEKDE